MYDLFLQLSIFISLGGLIYMVSRALPRMGDTEEMTNLSVSSWMSALPLDKFDAAFSGFLEKLLRRSRLVVMRTDSWLNLRLSNLKASNGNGRNGAPHFLKEKEEKTGGE